MGATIVQMIKSSVLHLMGVRIRSEDFIIPLEELKSKNGRKRNRL